MGGCIQGNEVYRGVGCLWDPWRAYLKRLSPAPSSHWGRCTLIRCASTRDPCMQRWVGRTKVIAILLLTYPHILESDYFHLVARRLANLLRVAVAWPPSGNNPTLICADMSRVGLRSLWCAPPTTAYKNPGYRRIRSVCSVQSGKIVQR